MDMRDLEAQPIHQRREFAATSAILAHENGASSASPMFNRLRRVIISRGAALALMLMYPQPIILPPSSVLVVCSSPNCQVETVIYPGLLKRIFMEWARMYKRPE